MGFGSGRDMLLCLPPLTQHSPCLWLPCIHAQCRGNFHRVHFFQRIEFLHAAKPMNNVTC